LRAPLEAQGTYTKDSKYYHMLIVSRAQQTVTKSSFSAKVLQQLLILGFLPPVLKEW
jgi:hypothetical protein